jgi:hypothetical protein
LSGWLCHITSIKLLWFSKFHERKELNGSNVQIHSSRRTSMKEHNECNNHAKWRDCMIQDDLPYSWCVMGFRKAHDDFWTNVDFEDVAFNLVFGNTIVLLLSCYSFPMNSSNVEFGSCFTLQPSIYRLYIAMFSCSKIVPLFCTVCFLKCKIDLVYLVGT